MTDRRTTTDRRTVLKATAGLLATGSLAGCTDGASQALEACMSTEPTDREKARKRGLTSEWVGERSHMPTDDTNHDADLGMELSGQEFTAGDGSGTAAHTIHIARGSADLGYWFHDRVDMTGFGGPDATEGKPVTESAAAYLEEGGTAVFLVAENDRGMLASPDARAFEMLLPERIRREAVGLEG